MAITIYNMRIVPYTQKDTIKPVYGNTMELTFVLPEPYELGDEYMLGMDYDRTLVPTVRPICAFTNEYTIDNKEITFKLILNWQRFRDWVSRIKKPTPVWLQMVRKRNEVYTTLLLDDVLALPSIIDGAGTTFPGDPILDLLDRKMDKTEVEGTEGQVLTMGEDGHYAWADLPEIPEQEQADWNESDSSEASYIKHKPDLSIYVEKEVGKGLSTNDFTDADKAKLGGIEDNAQVNVQADWDDSDSDDDAFIRNKPAFSTVALTGSYNDLIDKPVIPEPTPQLQADWEESDSSEMSYIKHKPDLSVYSLITETGNKISMSIDDEYDLVVNLLDKNDNVLSTQDIDLPIEAMIVDATYANGILTLTLQNGNTVDVDISDIVSGLVPDSRTINGHALSSDVTITAQDLGLATVATSGSYNDLTDKPVVEQSDWDESDSTEASYIKNKPVIPVVNNATVTINQGGVQKGTFTLNQNVNATIDLNDGAQSNWDESDSSEVSYILNKPNVEPKIDELSTFFYELYDESSSSVEPADHEPLTITMNDPSYSQGIRFFCQFTTSTWDINMQYSYDKQTWNDFTFSSEIGNSYSSTVYIGKGYTSDHVYIRGNNNGNYFASAEYFVFNTTENSSINNAVKLSGNLFSIFSKENYWNLTDFNIINTYGQYGCYSLFRNTDGEGRYFNNIIDAGDLIIPALILTPYMCNNMFRATSITRAPYLPSTYPLDSCYASMFYDCASLQEISVGFFQWVSVTSNWVSGVSATGTFKCRASLPTTTTGDSGIPTGWTVQYF